MDWPFEELTRCSLLNRIAQPQKLIYSLICLHIMLAFKIVHRRGADRTPHCLREINDGKLRWFCLAYFAPNRCRDQPQKRPVVQSHGITLSFHREMADASRELVGPDVTAAVSFESYPRFIKGGFQDYEGLGIKRSTANSPYRSGRSPDWLKFKNPAAPAVRREAEEDWGGAGR